MRPTARARPGPPRSGAVLRLAVARALPLVAAAATVPAMVPGAALAAAQTVPHPIEVGPAPAEAPAALTIRPALLTLDVSDGDASASLAVVNGGDVPVALALAVREVTGIDDDGPQVGDDLGLDAPLLLPAATARLGAGEQARVGLVASTDAADTSLFAVTAGPADAPPQEQATAFVVVGDGTRREVSADVDLRTGADSTEAVVTVSAPGPAAAAVDLRVRVRSWLGTTMADRVERGYLVLPGGERELVFPLSRLVLPGRLTVEVAAAHRGEPAATATATAWHWDPAMLGAIALVVAGALLVAEWRRRRRGRRGDDGTHERPAGGA